MANWLMGALAAQDRYDPEEGALQAATLGMGPSPAEIAAARVRQPYRGLPEAGSSPLPAVLGGVLSAVAKPVMTPGAQMTKNPHLPGTELHDWFEDQRARTAQNWGPEMALNLFGTGTVFAKPGTAGIFGGKLAKTADHAALAKAEDMLAKKATPDDIWNATGWFQGADKKWRFEIPDRLTHWRGDPAKLLSENPAVMGEAFYHPELYKAYPELYGVDVTAGAFGGRGMTKGSYSSGFGVDNAGIKLAPGKPEAMRSTNLHELQHGVEDIEGFAMGGGMWGGLSPGTPEWKIYQERVKAIRTPASKADLEASGVLGPEYTYEQYLKEHKAALKDPVQAERLNRAAQETAIRQGYERRAGEVDARAVQRRADYLPDKLKDVPPYYSYDVPMNEQIVKFRQGLPGGRPKTQIITDEVVDKVSEFFRKHPKGWGVAGAPAGLGAYAAQDRYQPQREVY